MEASTGPEGVPALQLRHPNVLAFKDTAEVEEKGETVLYLVTEPVKPLADVLEELDMEGSARYRKVPRKLAILDQ